MKDLLCSRLPQWTLVGVPLLARCVLQPRCQHADVHFSDQVARQTQDTTSICVGQWHAVEVEHRIKAGMREGSHVASKRPMKRAQCYA